MVTRSFAPDNGSLQSDLAQSSASGSAVSSPLSLQSGNIVVSQIYGAGGTAGATYNASYIELFNRTNVPADFNGYQTRIAPTGSGQFEFSISVVSSRSYFIAAGQRLLIQIGNAGTNGAALPVTPDFVIASPGPPIPTIALGTAGKIAITLPNAPTFSTPCPLPDSNIVEFVGFGSAANCFEGSAPTPTLTNRAAALRAANGCTDSDDNAGDFSLGTPAPRNSSSPVTPCASAVFQFSAPNYIVDESVGGAVITVNRTGNTSVAQSVRLATSDFTASQRTDYTLTNVTLNFAAGETSKAAIIPIVNDAYQESQESLELSLSNPSSDSVVGSQATANLFINSDDSAPPTTNPIDNARLFARQHYSDFLARVPDQGGEDYWTQQTAQCGMDAACLNSSRIGVSTTFFTELEFQRTGAYVYRLYRAAFGDSQPASNPSGGTEAAKLPGYGVFAPDRARIDAAANVINQSLVDLATDFASRSAFTARYPTTQTAEQFVDALIANIQAASGVSLTSQRATLINEFNTGGRGRVMFRLAQDDATSNPVDNRAYLAAENNRAFVLMQYFGYLRRDPDIGGYQFWLGVINGQGTSGARFMVCNFITSQEYQERFSSVVTRNNSLCNNNP